MKRLARWSSGNRLTWRSSTCEQCSASAAWRQSLTALQRIVRRTPAAKEWGCRALWPRGTARTIDLYKQWVHKLAVAEFADELVVMAVARELGIRICCIPHTPGSAPSPWAPSTYGAPPVPGSAGDTIYVGNNDVRV